MPFINPIALVIHVNAGLGILAQNSMEDLLFSICLFNRKPQQFGR